MAKRREKTQDISRAEASRVLNTIAYLVRTSTVSGRDEKLTSTLTEIFTEAGIRLPRPCPGEAHENPNIDHCSLCMPDWGIIYHMISVKKL